MAIDPQTIVDEALKLLDEVGIDNLTTRKLAERLGVQQPALYWHFKNKRALLDAMDATMMRRHHSYSVPKPGDDWREFLRESGRSFRRALLSHRDGSRVHAGAAPDTEDLSEMEAELGCMVAAGFSVLTSIETMLTIGNMALGSAMDQQADEAEGRGWDQPGSDKIPGLTPLLAQAMRELKSGGREAAFETGLTIIIDGLEARLKSGRA